MCALYFGMIFFEGTLVYLGGNKNNFKTTVFFKNRNF